MRKTTLLAITGLLLSFLTVCCGTNGTSFHLKEGESEERKSEERKSEEREKKKLNAILKSTRKQFSELASQEETIKSTILALSFFNRETLWKQINAQLGDNNAELLIKLTVLGNDDYGSVIDILTSTTNELGSDKAKYLIEQLIQKLLEATTTLKAENPVQFKIITQGGTKEYLCKGVTHLRDLAIVAGMGTEKSAALGKALGFKRWAWPVSS